MAQTLVEFKSVVTPAALVALLTIVQTACLAQELPHPGSPAVPPAVARFTGSPNESFDLEHSDGLLYVSALVNGKPAYFIIDSLWGTDALTADAARRLGVVPPTTGDLASTSGTIARLQIGGFVLLHDPVTIVPSAGWKVDGLLGYGLFSQAVVGIHWVSGRMTISDPARFKPASGTTAVPITILDDRSAVVAAKVDGIDGLFQLEAGNPEGLILNPGFVLTNHLREKYAGGSPTTAPAAPSADNHVLLDDFEIGAFDLRKSSALLPKTVAGSPDDTSPVAGRIGNDILDRFNVTFDYPHQQLFVQKNESFEKPEPIADPAVSTTPAGTQPNTAPSSPSPAAVAAKRRVTAFAKTFQAIAAKTGAASAYDRLCTSDFTMSIRLFGSVQRSVTRSEFIDSVRHSGLPAASKPGGIIDMSPTVLFQAATGNKGDQALRADSVAKVSNWRPDWYENKTTRIVYYSSPAFTMSSPTNSHIEMTFEEVYLKTGSGIRLQNVSLVGLAITVAGDEFPVADIKSMFEESGKSKQKIPAIGGSPVISAVHYCR